VVAILAKTGPGLRAWLLSTWSYDMISSSSLIMHIVIEISPLPSSHVTSENPALGVMPTPWPRCAASLLIIKPSLDSWPLERLVRVVVAQDPRPREGLYLCITPAA